jgi:PIN domain nuclease of toxin-antitoxin system
MIHLDTHVLMWLSGGEQERVPAAARERLQGEPVSCAPMAQLELAHLYEIGRITRGASDVLGVLAPALGLAVSAAPFAAVVAYALDLTWTRDPFDRLIAANALVDGAGLLIADESILANCPAAFWQQVGTP